MTTDFDKARKWRRVQLVSGVALVVVAICAHCGEAVETMGDGGNTSC